jgi:hypothetical protein
VLIASGIALVIGFFMPWLTLSGLASISGFGLMIADGQAVEMVLNKGPLRRTRVIDVLTLTIQALAWILERLDRPERWTWAYLVVARRR